MVATITISGRMGTGPQCYTTESGNHFTRFRMAHTPRIRKDNTWEDGETVWFTVRTYGQLAANAAMLRQGDPVLAVGQWRVETWVDNNNSTRVDNVLMADTLGPDFQFCRAQIIPRMRDEIMPDRPQAAGEPATEATPAPAAEAVGNEPSADAATGGRSGSGEAGTSANAETTTPADKESSTGAKASSAKPSTRGKVKEAVSSRS